MSILMLSGNWILDWLSWPLSDRERMTVSSRLNSSSTYGECDVKSDCADSLRSSWTIRFCAYGGIAVSASSIAKITFCLSSAICDSIASTSMLIVPVPCRKKGAA